MPTSDILQNLASNYVQTGLNKIVDFWRSAQFKSEVKKFFDRYKEKIFEKIDTDSEFDFEALETKVLGELLPELVLSRTAKHAQQRKKAFISFYEASYAYAGAEKIAQKQAVFSLLTSLTNIVDNHLASVSELDQYSICCAVEDIEQTIKECFTDLKADVSLLQSTLETTISYSGSFAEFIDNISPKAFQNIKFHYLNPRIGFFGRVKELSQLDSFLQDQESIRFCVVTGVGGAGKSKLVFEFVRDHEFDTKWKFVYITPDRFEKITTFSKWDYDQNLLLIFDYAGNKSSKIGSWVRTLCETAASARPNKIRLLLLERQGFKKDASERISLPYWYQKFIGTGEQRIIISNLLYQPEEEQLFINVAPLQNIDMANLIRNYSETQMVSLTETHIKEILQHLEEISQNKPHLKTPLFALMITDAYINKTSFRRWNVTAIMDFIQERMLKNIEQSVCNCDNDLFKAVYKLLIYSTAASPWEIGTNLPDPFSDASAFLNSLEFSDVNTLLLDINSSGFISNRICQIEPDPIAEFMVLDFAKNNILHCELIFRALWQHPERLVPFMKNAINTYSSNRYFALLFDGDMGWLLNSTDIDCVRKARYELWLELIFASTRRRAKNIINLMRTNLSDPILYFEDYLYYAKAVNYALDNFAKYESRKWADELVNDLANTYGNLLESGLKSVPLLPIFADYYVSSIRTLIQIYDESGLWIKIRPLLSTLTVLSNSYPDLLIESVISETELILMTYENDIADYEIPYNYSEDEFIDVHPPLRIPNAEFLESSESMKVDSFDWCLYGINIIREVSKHDNFFGLFQDYGRYFDHHVSYYPYESNRVFYVSEDDSDVYFVLYLDHNFIEIEFPNGVYRDVYESESSDIDFCNSGFLFNE